MYLKSAQWGFDELLTKKLSGYAFRFYSIGILASLRAVQHALMNHDSTLSDEHKRLVEEWRGATPLSTPELHFIRTSRDLILNCGSFAGYSYRFGIFDGRGIEPQDNRHLLRVGILRRGR
jgi:hypothetical protein